MASKSKFHIPSLDEMTSSGVAVEKPAVRSLFQSHKAEKQSTTTMKPAASSVQTKPAVPSSVTNSANVPSRTSVSNAGHSASNNPPAPGGSNGNRASSSESRTFSHTTSAESGSKTGSPLKSNVPPSGVPLTPTKPGSKTVSLIVNPRQRGNPILKAVRSVPWEFGDIVPDYELGQTTCALFLSLRYHHLNPEYIHQRLKQLAHSYELRILLVQVDVKDPHHSLKELAKMCILADCTLILAFSPEEAGRYLETYKAFENKPADLIKERTDSNFLAKMTDVLTSVKKVNKTDASTLLSTFGTVADIVKASEEDLSLCPGFGPQKARRLHEIMHEPFLKKKKVLASPEKQASRPGTPKKTHSKTTSAADSSAGKESPLKQSLLTLSPGPRKRIAHKPKDEEDDAS